MRDYQNASFHTLPEEKKEGIIKFVSSTCENNLKMNSEQRSSLIGICFSVLDYELRMVPVEDFDCGSYEELLYQIVLAAAGFDGGFSLEKDKITAEAMKSLGLDFQFDQTDSKDIDLVKLSAALKQPMRAYLFSIVSIILIGGKEPSEDAKEYMRYILAP